MPLSVRGVPHREAGALRVYVSIWISTIPNNICIMAFNTIHGVIMCNMPEHNLRTQVRYIKAKVQNPKDYPLYVDGVVILSTS